ncbi:hypothetical protein DL764_008099 [Monosporascus ibericus]|uniref:Uncharacterized protein n=1 Tax=Monosporascus ibericus TaxID=155417 RepID=A0A4Q4T0I0_9PEZI|nr:hypothetical protein DL764_008099 [Monosporascus ibericus]
MEIVPTDFRNEAKPNHIPGLEWVAGSPKDIRIPVPRNGSDSPPPSYAWVQNKRDRDGSKAYSLIRREKEGYFPEVGKFTSLGGWSDERPINPQKTSRYCTSTDWTATYTGMV